MSIRQTEQEQITALYERLSRDDEQLGDSNSIVMQKRMLEDYAAQHGFSNCAHYTDDGYTGGNFERPDWKRLVADIENGKVAAVLVKDMSRVGRDYLQTGFFTEVFFPQHGVRFIAITNGVDSADRQSGEFAPFLNIMNEWYLRDASRKQKQSYLARSRANLFDGEVDVLEDAAALAPGTEGEDGDGHADEDRRKYKYHIQNHFPLYDCWFTVSWNWRIRKRRVRFSSSEGPAAA